MHSSPPQAGPAPSSLWSPASPPRDPLLSLHHPLPRGCRRLTGAPAEESDSRCLPAASWRPGPPPRPYLSRYLPGPRGSVSFEPLVPFHTSPPRTREHPPPPRCTPASGGARAGVMQALGKEGRQRLWRPHLGCTGVLGRGPCLISRCTPAPHPRTAPPPVPHGEIRCSESLEQSLPTPIHPPLPTSGSLKAGFCET